MMDSVAVDACLVRDRVTRLYNFYFPQRNPMPPFDNDDTAGNPFAQQRFHRKSHPRCRLARADEIKIAVLC